MTRQPINIYNEQVWGMKTYLHNYGWHFTKRACDIAVKAMRRYNEATNKLEPIEPLAKEEVDDLLKRNGIVLKYNIGHDYVYVANMAKADYYNSSITDEEHLAKFVKDTIDDQDGADGEIMQTWYCKMAARGLPVDWEEIL